MDRSEWPAWLQVLVRAALCSAVGAAVWRLAGPVPAILTIPLWGALLARPLIDLASDLRQHARARATADLEGRHHAFGGVSLDITDDGRHLWLRADDLQRALRSRDTEAVLAARFSGRWQRSAADGPLRLRVDAVVDHLATSPDRMDPRRLRLRRMLQQQALEPARLRRSRTT